VGRSFAIAFSEATAGEREVAGGKGASLAHLAGAGFPVPPGFVVTTAAYREFIEANDLTGKLTAILDRIDFGDADAVEASTGEIRAMIASASFPPAVVEAIRTGYHDLGEIPVAVRSSGTAEDMAEASFAGQHDTYLDVRGTDRVVEAVRDCWASLWSARVTAYREANGVDQRSVSIAVVVQSMIAAEVAGVLFTANPMNAAQNEYVVNASWGLGESVVSGVVTPDQFVLNARTLAVKERLLGTKERRIDRDPAAPTGTTVLPVADDDRSRFSLSDTELRHLGELGRRVQRHVGEWPQDIEWAYADGEFYLLQSRDVTGVDFSWDEALNTYTDLPDDEDVVWSRAVADEVWCGAATPLFFSFRAPEVQRLYADVYGTLWGRPDTGSIRALRYHRAQAYFHTEIDHRNRIFMLPPALRTPDMFAWSTAAAREGARSEPFSLTELARTFGRIGILDSTHSVYKWKRNAHARIAVGPGVEADGLPLDQIAELTDDELKRYVQERIDLAVKWFAELWSGLFLHTPLALSAFNWMLVNWYHMTDPMVFVDLITGLPRATKTMVQNSELWELAQQIRQSPELSERFRAVPGAAFFDGLEELEDGRAFLARYRSFLAEFGHQGHADRDIIYDRRVEDPGVDYRALQALLTTDGSTHPHEMEKRLIARREQVTAEVVDVIRQQPFGAVKAELFKHVQDYVLDVWTIRDDERHHSDRYTFAKKRAFKEVGRRLVDRGLLTGEEDFYFLSQPELYELLDGKPVDMRIIRAKIAGRRKNFEAYRTTWTPPMYLQDNAYPDIDGTATEVEGNGSSFRGVGTSRGLTTGTARVVPSLADIGRIEKGDVLIVNSTDPGWTPVFLVISGLVLETGGMLAHGSCVSREYGIPAVTLAGAMSLIPDGAQVTVNGDTGEVRLLQDEDAR
jgi:pyruvate,water dikinase